MAINLIGFSLILLNESTYYLLGVSLYYSRFDDIANIPLAIFPHSIQRVPLKNFFVQNTFQRLSRAFAQIKMNRPLKKDGPLIFVTAIGVQDASAGSLSYKLKDMIHPTAMQFFFLLLYIL